MTVAVTGATGFVGRQVLRVLLDRGQRVRAVVRDGSELPTSVDVATVNDLFTTDISDLSELLADSDTLIHLAWYAEPGKYLQSPQNIECLTGTMKLAKAFREAGGKRFVGIGTCAEYDTAAGVLATTTPLAPTTLYAACKASAYMTLSHYFDVGSFAWCRIFYLYGEGEDERRLVPYVRRQLTAGEEVLLSRGDQVRDFMDVKDAARMIVDTALGDRHGAVNICSGQGITIRELVESIADEYGRNDLLRFGAKPDNAFDPPKVVGVQ
ncbi:NAD-dependent epimerase/dehydratase family protein [Mycobacterium sp. pR1184]|uniref:NAD-dependent epimerase/dehydratase family protein n=1 Tax=Mycobacterium sp. pR1184 TaxID=3238981 RepID=UPI00351B1D1D